MDGKKFPLGNNDDVQNVLKKLDAKADFEITDVKKRKEKTTASSVYYQYLTTRQIKLHFKTGRF